jgi:hypothetical protein
VGISCYFQDVCVCSCRTTSNTERNKCTINWEAFVPFIVTHMRQSRISSSALWLPILNWKLRKPDTTAWNNQKTNYMINYIHNQNSTKIWNGSYALRSQTIPLLTCVAKCSQTQSMNNQNLDSYKVLSSRFYNNLLSIRRIHNNNSLHFDNITSNIMYCKTMYTNTFHHNTIYQPLFH